MLTIHCSSMSCALRSDCRVVNAGGSSRPLLDFRVKGLTGLVCYSERITRKDKKFLEKKEKPSVDCRTDTSVDAS